ncbi:hypothetical protein ACSYDW_01250 [Paeniglutamicibacter sp. R2-26]|uniref:hypothetical protein n=1 Tax=Paeniglutamicibacter sp. R2-26 TaxID=3144417 RepID=UPI003EE6B215
MGYGAYTLPDGREAGYLVDAPCDKSGCDTKIDRGLGFLCGQNPEGWRDANEPGCGNYYCAPHRYGEHDCTNPACDLYSADGNACCGLVKGHDLPHENAFDGTKFTETEDDQELAGENPQVTPLGEYGEDWLVTGTSDAHSAEEAVRAGWKADLSDEDYQEQYGDVQLGDLRMTYRNDWAWKRYPGRTPEEPLDEGDELVSGAKAHGLPIFAGYMVTL